MKKKILSFITSIALLMGAVCTPMHIAAETAVQLTGFDVTESDSSFWKTGGWSGTNAMADGTATVTNGWAHYGGVAVSNQTFSFKFNTTATSGALQIFFRNAVTQDKILSGNSSTATAGEPFMFTYSATSGQIYFNEYSTDSSTGKAVSTQLRNEANSAYSGGSIQGLNDGNDHVVTIETIETDITQLKLYIDGNYLFSSYWHGGVKQAGYISFITYAQKTFNITELYIDGVNADPALMGQDTDYVSFGFESGVNTTAPKDETSTVYAEGIAGAAHSGDTGLHIVKEAGSSCWFYVALSDADTSALKSGKTYRASMYIKTNPEAAASGQTTFNFYSGPTAGSTTFKGNPVVSDVVSNWGIDKGYGDYLDTAKDPSDGEWTKMLISSEFTVQADYPYIVLVVWADSKVAFDWYIDDIEFCEISQVNINNSNITGGGFKVEKADNIYSIGLGTEGSIEVKDGDWAYGDTVSLTANADDGYSFEGWYLNGEKVIGAGEEYSFKLTANTEITAKFEQGYNIIRASQQNWSLTGAAELGDTISISNGGSALLNSLLLSNHTVKLRFSSFASACMAFIGNETEYCVDLTSNQILLNKRNGASEEQLASAVVQLEELAEHEMYLSIAPSDSGTAVKVTLDGAVLIDFVDLEKADFSGMLTISGNDTVLTYVGVEGLLKSDFNTVSTVKQNIDKTAAINIGSSFLTEVNAQYAALENSLSIMLPNTALLEKANAVYNEFLSANLIYDSLISIYDFCSIEQRDGGRLKLMFKTNETINTEFETAGFTRKENGAAVLPTSMLNGNSLYADTDSAETFTFGNNGNDISRYSISIGNCISRQRRNTELSVRGYSVYEKDGIQLVVYSEPKTTSFYQAAVNQYNMITLETLETSVYNGERALLYLSGDTESQVIDISVIDIKENIKPLGRTSYSDSALLIDRALAGFAISGRFQGDVCAELAVNLNNVSCMYIYSVVDGDYANAKRITVDCDGEYVLASFEQVGEHTVEIIKATEGGLAKLDVKSLKVTGALYKMPAAKDLSIEFMGDSITSGWGVYTYEELNTEDQSVVSDAFLNYASYTAQALNADISVISRSGIRTEQLFEEQYPYIHDRSKEAWSYTSHPDIIVVNLGQNDVGTYQNDQDAFAEIVAQKIAYLRELHPNAAIVWVNGMMSTTMMPAIEQAVASIDDSLVFSLCLPTNTDGQWSHPSVSGQAQAGEALTEYLKETVIPAITAE